jgi:G2/mitotic-specific cyclin-B, other
MPSVIGGSSAAVMPSEAVTRPSTAASSSLLSSSISLPPVPAAFDRDHSSDVEVFMRDLTVDQVKHADVADSKRVADYCNEIIRHHMEKEITKCPKGTSMAAQTDINEKFRGILVDWLVEVHLKFKLSPETLYLTVSIMDRFLEKKIISRTTLQLVGIASLLLASKYEEIYAPAVRDLVFVSARAYTREEILRMETTMLNALKFQLTVPTAFIFLQRLLKVVDADARLTNLAHFYVERTLQEYSMLRYVPSMVAASGLFLAMKALASPSRPATWTSTLQHFSGYSESQLRECVAEFHSVLAGATTAQLQGVRKKYTSSKYMEVAKTPLPTL